MSRGHSQVALHYFFVNLAIYLDQTISEVIRRLQLFTINISLAASAIDAEKWVRHKPLGSHKTLHKRKSQGIRNCMKNTTNVRKRSAQAQSAQEE